MCYYINKNYVSRISRTTRDLKRRGPVANNRGHLCFTIGFFTKSCGVVDGGAVVHDDAVQDSVNKNMTRMASTYVGRARAGARWRPSTQRDSENKVENKVAGHHTVVLVVRR